MPTHDELSAAHTLTVETGGDQFPVSPAMPELSWQLPSSMTRQEARDLQARIDGQLLEHFSSGPAHRFIAWPWLQPLRSGSEVQWRVRVHDAKGPLGWSDWGSFEAGWLEPDWTAQWISPPVGQQLPVGERPGYILSTTFTVDSPPTRARLYAAALGVYEAFINGHRVGTAELSPGSESYDRTIYGQASDVADLLAVGENTFEMLVTDGWYRGRAGAFRQQAAWGTQTAVRAQLQIGAGDDSVTLVSTEPGWAVTDSLIVSADLMDGQIEDRTKTRNFVGHAIPGPQDIPPVTWSPAPPVRVVTELAPISITRISDDTVVVDFGQNASGWVRLAGLGPAGTRTVLDFGEHIGHDGDLTLEHLDTEGPAGRTSFSQRDEVVSDGEPDAVFEPRHTVHGFQYVRVQRPGLHLDAEQIRMRVVHSDLRPVGSFSSSDTDLVRLWDVADWSFRGNAVDVPTDCPTRERAGWTGDWQIFLPTAVRLFDVDGFSRKWLQSVRDDQLDDGRIVNISPDNARLRTVPDAMSDMATGSAGWGDAVVLVPWELYRAYGDVRVLEDTWDAMTKWVDFALRSAANNRHPSRIERSAEPLKHETYIWDGTFHFGEWLEPTPISEDGTPGPTMPDPMAWAMADKGEVGTAYLYRSVSTLAQIASVLGLSEQASNYAETAGKVRDAWRREFLTENARTVAGTQASYVRALAFDLIPDALRETAAGHLVELILDADTHLGTGFLSTADLLPVLADHGYADVAHQLLLRRTSPSWLGMLDRGATTIWEEWEGIDRNGNAHASLNHYSKGAVIRYLQTHTLGLSQSAWSVAWEHFTVTPMVAEHLTWASGHFDSPQGRIDVSWKLEGDDATLSVVVPGGASARARWGDVVTDLGPGAHTLRASARSVRSAASAISKKR